jgi:hypothetical protein
MSISYLSNNGSSGVTTDFTIAWPGSSVAAGRLAVLVMIGKAYNHTASVSGWTPLVDYANGTTANGADVGSVHVQVWYKLLDGTESGSVAVTLSANVASATSSAASNSATASTNPGLSANDLLLVVLGLPGDTSTPSSPAVSAMGATFDPVNSLRNSVTNTGFDAGIQIALFPVLTGPSSAPPVYTWTGMSAGAAAFVRLRESGGAGSPSYYYKQL